MQKRGQSTSLDLLEPPLIIVDNVRVSDEGKTRKSVAYHPVEETPMI